MTQTATTQTAIRQMAKSTLIAFAAKKFNKTIDATEKKETVMEMVLSLNAEAIGTKMQNDIIVTDSIRDIIDNVTVSKAEKFRALHDLGMATAQISREMNSHYSFVHGTIQRYVASKNATTEAESILDAASVVVPDPVVEVPEIATVIEASSEEGQEIIIKAKKSRKKAAAVVAE